MHTFEQKPMGRQHSPVPATVVIFRVVASTLLTRDPPSRHATGQNAEATQLANSRDGAGLQHHKLQQLDIQDAGRQEG